jgi:hypothetical protein
MKNGRRPQIKKIKLRQPKWKQPKKKFGKKLKTSSKINKNEDNKQTKNLTFLDSP